MSDRLDPVDAPMARSDYYVADILTLLSERIGASRSTVHSALLDAGWDGLSRFIDERTVSLAVNTLLANTGS